MWTSFNDVSILTKLLFNLSYMATSYLINTINTINTIKIAQANKLV